jgi:DNA-binding response OmpR family regulator
VLDPMSYRVSRGREEIHLTATEFKLLESLMRASGKVVSKRTIVEAVWGPGVKVEDNTLHAFVRLLRKKVDEGRRHPLIQTVRGFGYRTRTELK